MAGWEDGKMGRWICSGVRVAVGTEGWIEGCVYAVWCCCDVL